MLSQLLQQLQGAPRQQWAAAPAPGEATREGGLRGILQGVGIPGVPMATTGGFRQPNYMSLLGMRGTQPQTWTPPSPTAPGAPGGGTPPINDQIRQFLIDNGMMTTIDPYSPDGMRGMAWNGQLMGPGDAVPLWAYIDALQTFRAGGE